MSKESLNISRRDFFNLAGGVAGATALASLGMNSAWAQNSPSIDITDVTEDLYKTDVLVIGGGMAGLFAAVKAHDQGAKVMMVSKGGLGASGQTPFAKGFFSYDAKTADYTIDEFAAKIRESALDSNNPIYTKQLAEHSKARVEELREWGFFDSSLCRNSFQKPMKERQIPVLERITITHLLKENGRICGAAGFSVDDAKVHFINAKSVILCTGAGGFKPNGFPICDLTHDGTIMAYNIGAKVTGKEWNDGHPAKMDNPADCYGGWGNMFEKIPSTTSIGIRHDLGVDMNVKAYAKGDNASIQGPFVPAAYARNEQKGGGPPEGGGRPPEGGERPQGERPKNGGRPPMENASDNKGRNGGGPPKGNAGEGGGPPGMGGARVGGSSAGMSIHKSEGLVPIDDRCASTIKGLYAAGDALGSYMAGAIYTQIGSSLAGSAVQGAIAGEASAEYAMTVSQGALKKKRVSEVTEEILAPLRRKEGYSPAWVTQTLQGIMIPNFVLYVKKETMMRAALAYVEELRDNHMPYLTASDMHELRLAHETENMIISAEMKLKASLMRKESRCSHFRLDYPELDNENWRAWINIYKGDDGTMKFEKQSFDDWGKISKV